MTSQSTKRSISVSSVPNQRWTQAFISLTLISMTGSMLLYAWRAPVNLRTWSYSPPHLVHVCTPIPATGKLHYEVSPIVVTKGLSQTTSDQADEQGIANAKELARATRKFTTATSNHDKGFALNGTCRPSNNIVLIKVHKCASSTIANIFTRYGLKHHLNFALPRHDIGHIGWPKSLLPEHLTEPIGEKRQINVIAHHITYNETTLTKFMPKDTKYFGILREPFSHFKSSMFYFKETNQFHFKTKDKVSEFLNNPGFFERKIAFAFNLHHFGHRSMTMNFMSTEFGFNNDWRTDNARISEFIAFVKKNIDLVLIREHITESIVLMRRLLCWSMEDVISLSVNKQDYTKNAKGINYSSATEATLRAKYRNWSRVDFMMYDYFNKTLWEKIADQGPDFRSEVEVFSLINQLLTRYCADKLKQPSFVVPETSWNKQFEFKREECPKLTKGPHLFNKEIGVQMGLPRFKLKDPYAKIIPPKNVTKAAKA